MEFAVEEVITMPEPIEPDPNPITEVRKKVDGALVIEQTHKNPVTKTTTHNIAELEAKIAKYESVAAIWQEKADPLKALVLEYNSL